MATSTEEMIMKENVKLEEIEVGMTAMVRGGFGRELPAKVVIHGVHEEIKNGMGGIDYERADGFAGWAYLYQVDSVSGGE